MIRIRIVWRRKGNVGVVWWGKHDVITGVAPPSSSHSIGSLMCSVIWLVSWFLLCISNGLVKFWSIDWDNISLGGWRKWSLINNGADVPLNWNSSICCNHDDFRPIAMMIVNYLVAMVTHLPLSTDVHVLFWPMDSVSSLHIMWLTLVSRDWERDWERDGGESCFLPN